MARKIGLSLGLEMADPLEEPFRLAELHQIPQELITPIQQL